MTSPTVGPERSERAPAGHVVGRVAHVLREVARHEPTGAGTSAIARGTGLARPTTHRLLVSLSADGLIERDRETGAWLLGPELFFLGTAAAQRYDVTAVAQPAVHRLSAATGESAFFSARRGGETICLVREDGSFPIRSHVLSEGVRFPLGVASAGLVILAFLPDREIGEILAGRDLVADHGPSHAPARLRERIAATRGTGYAVNPGLVVEGSWGMAAAVFDTEGAPRWALSLTGIEQRFTEPRQREMGALLLQEAHDLSRRLRDR